MVERESWRRDEMIVLRVRRSERQLIEAAAQRAQERLSEFVRSAALRRGLAMFDGDPPRDAA